MLLFFKQRLILAITTLTLHHALLALEKPNILLILVNDQRHDALSCSGHPIIQTPHVDSLAKRGVHFKNAFVNSPAVASSRASIITGVSQRSHGLRTGDPSKKTLFTSGLSQPASPYC
jgi:arylsulfatase A-like enzyme